MQARRGRCGVLSAAALAVLLPRDASACLCAPLGIVVFPGPIAPVPCDVRPLVTLDKGWATEPLCDDAGKCVDTASHLELRPAATSTLAPTALAIEARVVADALATTGRTTVQLSPTAPLAAKTRFEIVLVEAKNRRPAAVVGTFRTGDGAAGAPPAAPAILSSVVVGAAPSKGLVLGCGPAAPVITLHLPPGGATPVRHLVWVAAGGSPDDTLPARALLAPDPPPPTGAPHETLSLGELGCTGNVADVPVAKDVHVRVRTVDAAGRRSAATELVVDTRAKTK
jgi:hypothetical protein